MKSRNWCSVCLAVFWIALVQNGDAAGPLGPQPVRTFDSGTGEATGSFLPDGQMLLIGAGLWDVQKGQLLHELEGRGRNAVSADGRLAVTETGTNRIALWDLTTRQALRSFDCPSRVTGLAMSPDARCLAVCGEENPGAWIVLVYRLEDGTLIQRIENAYNGAFSRDGATLATCGFRDVIVWDVNSGQPNQVFQIRDCGVQAAAFSPDNQRLAAVTSCNKCIYVWDVASGGMLHEWGGDGQDVKFSPDGRYLLVGGGSACRVFSLATRAELISLPYSGDSVDWSPDGNHVLERV